jgi:hypothetical protein
MSWKTGSEITNTCIEKRRISRQESFRKKNIRHIAIHTNDINFERFYHLSMKQVDKVIRKGDYYEMEIVDDGIFSDKPFKKEEIQSSIQINIDSILTDLPSFQ